MREGAICPYRRRAAELMVLSMLAKNDAAARQHLLLGAAHWHRLAQHIEIVVAAHYRGGALRETSARALMRGSLPIKV
jgi:hypothetical protein